MDLVVVRQRFKRRAPDFKEFFHLVRYNKSVFVNLYLTTGERNYTLSFYVKQARENIYTLSFHNTGETAIYNYTTDCLIKDIHFSKKLHRFFKNVPQSPERAFARGVEIVNRVTGWKWRLVRRFCDNLLEKWYAPDEKGVAPYAVWTWRKFQAEMFL